MQDDEIDLKRLILIIRRKLKLIAGITAVFFVLALVYILVTPARYTAETLLLLDKSITGTVSDISTVKQMGFDDAAISSEVEVIRSQNNVALAIKNLITRGYFKDSVTDASKMEQLTAGLSNGLQVSRVGKTYIISIKYTSTDPQKAADVANAYAEAYIVSQLDALSDMSFQTTAWLQEKMKDLSQKSLDASERAAEYRVQYNELQMNERQNKAAEPDDILQEKDLNLNELRNLEQEAATYQALYDSYLERLENISAQESFPVTETRIITAAETPRGKSHPKTVLILGASLIFGFGFSLVLALILDNMDKTLKRAGQIKKTLGLPFIGFLPLRKQGQKKKIQLTSVKTGPFNATLHTESIDAPQSLHAETISTLCNMLDNKDALKEKKVIGIISVDQNEGTSIVASNLALYTSCFAPTVLIEADIRKPSVFCPTSHTAIGTGDVLQNKAKVGEAMLQESAGRFSLLPSATKNKGKTVSHLSARNISGLINACKEKHDFIILDFPSLLSVSDVYGFAKEADYFVLVAEWGRTLPNTLDFYLRQNGIPKDKILGVVLENADMKKMEKLYGHKTTASLG